MMTCGYVVHDAIGDVLFDCAEAVATKLKRIASKDREHLVALYLNTRQQLLKLETVSIGTLNASLVHPREVFKSAIMLSAAAIIVAHNHPSGVSSPSPEDNEVTRRLKAAGDLLGITLLDHIIVAKQSYFSYKENGQLR